MVQWTNLQEILNLTQLYITCEKSGSLHLAELGLMVGGEAGRLAVRHTKFEARLKILKYCCRSKYSISALFSQDTALF